MASQHLKLALFSLLAAAMVGGCAVNPPPSAGASPSLPAAPMEAATQTPVAPAALALAGTEWAAFAVDGKAEVTNPKPKLRWLSADKVAGTGGCNGFTGPSVTGPDSMRLGPLASTGRACLSMPGSQEDLFFKAMELTRKAKIDRDQLVLMDESGKQLARFMKIN